MTPRPLNVALAGFGTVGRAVAERLCAPDRPARLARLLRLSHVHVRSIARRRVDWVAPDVVWTERFDDLLDPSVDILVEVIGGIDPAGDWISRALAEGKAVVTANKQLIAHHGDALFATAARHDRPLEFEAAVAGGIPVVRGLREGLAGDEITGIAGILNGTCNYMLTRMAGESLGFDTVLAEAQRLGFAEADPTDDLDGGDARAKLCVLARVGLGLSLEPQEVATASIRPLADIDFTYAAQLDCTIRQISCVRRHGADVEAWVRPALVPALSPYARVEGSQNLVVATGRSGGQTSFSGLGAGGGPTAVAVVSDLVAIAERGGRPVPSPGATVPPSTVLAAAHTPIYLRMVVDDRPGIIAAIAGVLAARGININAVLQEPGHNPAALPFVMTLEESDPSAVDAAVAEIARLPFHVQPPLALPMLTGA